MAEQANRAPDVDTFWNYAHTSMRKAMGSDWSTVAWNAFHLEEVRAILPGIMKAAFEEYQNGVAPMRALQTAVHNAPGSSRALSLLCGLFRMVPNEDADGMKYFFEN